MIDPSIVHPNVRRAIDAADRDQTEALLDLVIGRRRRLAAEGSRRDPAVVTRADMENWRHAVRMRSDVDAHIITRLVEHAWTTEDVIERLTRSISRTYAYLEDSDCGQYRRWRCCRSTSVDGTTACDVAGRWIYRYRSDADRIVSRGLAGHMESHPVEVEDTGWHPLVGEYVTWEEPGDLPAEAERLFVEETDG